MGKMKELSIQKDNDEVYCVGCEFIKIMSDDGIGYCKEHGDMDFSVKDMGVEEVIDRLGGNDLSLEGDV